MVGATGPKESIARRVARAAGVASAVAALLAAIATGVVATELLNERAEDAAHSTSRALAHELHEERASGPAHERIEDEIVHFGRIEARYVVREDGREVYRSPRVVGDEWPADGRCGRVEERRAIACTTEVGAIMVVAIVTEPVDETVVVFTALVVAAIAAAFGFAIAWSSTRAVLEPLPKLARGAASLVPGRLDLSALGTDDGLEEIDALRGQLRASFQRAEDALAALGRFGAVAAHELRSPLAALGAEIELAIEAGHMDVAALEDARARVAHLSDLVERLLVLASPRDQAFEVEETLSLRELAEESVAQPPSSIDSAGRVRAVIDPSSDDGRVDGDRTLLRAMIDNGVSNGCKFARSEVRVRVRQAGEQVVLEIDDDGPGLGAEDLARVFEPFYRTERARAAEPKGLGLGLALVADVVRMHRGTVEMTHAELGGARLRVTLPASAG